MKILHVIANLAPRYGGPSQVCLPMAAAVARLGHDVSIYTTNMDGSTFLNVPTDHTVVRDGVSIRFYPIQRPRFWGTSLPLAQALRATIPDYDIIHLHSLYLFHDWITGYWCRHYNVPYIVRPHGTLDPYIYRRHRLRKNIMDIVFQKRVLQQAAAIHFTSEEESRLAEPYTFGAPGIVIPLGLDVDKYENLPPHGTFRKQYPEIADRKIILFFGRLNFKKGLDILVKAFGALGQNRTDIHLVIAGPDDGMKSQIKLWLRRESVLDRTTFTGMLTGDDKLAVLRDSEVFILPSYSENFGVSVVEAMACELPVVISDKVNICHDIKLFEAGEVVSCNTEEVTNAAQRILDNPEKAHKMGRNGRILVRRRFSWSCIAYDLERCYRDIVLR